MYGTGAEDFDPKEEKLFDMNNNVTNNIPYRRNNSFSHNNPLYQSMTSNRRNTHTSEFDEISLINQKFEAEKTEEDWAREWAEIAAREGMDEDGIDPKPNPEEDDTIKIFACATMWHEDKNEMLQMLKAVMRLDKDQWARRMARENDPDEETSYYEIECKYRFADILNS